MKRFAWLISLLIFAFAILFRVSVTKAQSVDHIVVSQVQIAGQTANDEFIELFNPTQNIINLTGYKLTKKVSSGTESNLVASMSGVLQPNEYYLITPLPPDYTGAVVPDTNYSGASFIISGDNSILLYSDNGITLVDKVGFGSATATGYETSPFPTNPLPNGSIRRINNQDTDNNSIDFELLTTSFPRNSNYVQTTITPTPTPSPTSSPTVTSIPTPTSTPTEFPVMTPSSTPTIVPTYSPTPTVLPTLSPTASPTYEPTITPTPTIVPTISPTKLPTISPSPTPKPDKDRDRHFDNKFRNFISNCGRLIRKSFERLHEDSDNNPKKWPSINNYDHYSKKHF